jgi:predicted acylesterase/phospholipase RssA
MKKSEARSMQSTRKIKYLVIGGGGWRTIYTAGVFNKLNELQILNDIEAVAVCSGGCMAGFMLALGYDSHETLRFLQKHVLDGKFQIPLTFIPEHANSSNPYYTIRRQDGFFQRGFKDLANAGINSYLSYKNMVDAVRSGGVFHTQGLANVLWKLIAESPTLPREYKKKDLTFAELHECCVKYNKDFANVFKDIFVIVTEATAKGPKEKHYSYLDTPDESIILAGCASMAIPGLFRKVGNKRNLYDGSVTNSLPCRMFDNPIFFEEKDQATEMNMRTLAVCFADSEDVIGEWRDTRPNTKSVPKKTALGNWLVLNLLWNKKLWETQLQEHQKGANSLRTLYINCAEIPILGPDSLSSARYIEICNQIAEQTEQYVDNYLRTDDPHFPDVKKTKRC